MGERAREPFRSNVQLSAEGAHLVIEERVVDGRQDHGHPDEAGCDLRVDVGARAVGLNDHRPLPTEHLNQHPQRARAQQAGMERDDEDRDAERGETLREGAGLRHHDGQGEALPVEGGGQLDEIGLAARPAGALGDVQDANRRRHGAWPSAPVRPRRPSQSPLSEAPVSRIEEVARASATMRAAAPAAATTAARAGRWK